ncbi:GRP family sugar transporter [Polycladomyces sp. WAk]|uniref:GRP family sugar transporter n=1 Tax=Polycladomyces zharkentensis TaxID=2807616 RepID=A0ABS2WEW6_9BACL|nr:GRP family sugar transporter [Polycladomyces sp. WAk]MBN2907955.1 GRP family sugar transporter [Polycladomyces sp. WAk]
MDILLALIPALAWGSIVLLNVKLGGGPYSQTLGTTIGALVFSIVIFLFVQPPLSPLIFIVGILSGLFWALGQRNQLKSVEYMGVSKTMPISTGMQLVSTTLFGVIVFKEWSTLSAILFGTIALILIVIGIVLTSLEDENRKDTSRQTKKGIVTLIVSTVGYLIYVVIVRLFHIDSWSALFPQAIGMVVGGVMLTYKHKPFNRYTLKNILPGVVWATGNLFLFISQPKVGVAISFSLSQLGIIVSTLGGIVFLGEKKTKRQLIGIVTGIILIVIGAVFLGLAKS